ncbi:site-specific integrase, partial [Phocaeicola sp.]
MATIKVKFRFSSNDSREGVLYYQIAHNRIVRQIGTKYKLFPYEWDNQFSSVVLSGDDTAREKYLMTLKLEIETDINRLKKIISGFHCSNMSFTSEDIVRNFQEPCDEKRLFVFMQTIIKHLRNLERIRTSETYEATLNSFMQFRNKEDILLDEIDSELMAAYEAWLQSRGVSANTSSFYMRNLRAVYNRAVRKDIVQQHYPFRYVYTGVDKTVKRALPLKTIKQIKEMDLLMFPSLDFARNMFLFSFYTRGMSFVDMAYLKK